MIHRRFILPSLVLFGCSLPALARPALAQGSAKPPEAVGIAETATAPEAVVAAEAAVSPEAPAAPAFAEPATPVPAPIAELPPAPAADDIEHARVTLAMRDAPLLQIFKLLAAASPARFRYGAPPDAVVSPALKDELVLPGVEKLLSGSGWQMRRDGANLFLLPGEGRKAPFASSWNYWAGAKPPQGWYLPPVSRVAIRTGTMLNQGEAPRLVSPLSPKTQWKLLRPKTNADLRPGLQIDSPGVGLREPLNLRWKLPLRVVPPHAQLLIEVPSTARATLYVNGAPLLRNWSGLKLVDLSRSLQPGDNVLAIVRRAAAVPVKNNSAVPVVRKAPFLLRYEWFFEGQAEAVGASENDS